MQPMYYVIFALSSVLLAGFLVWLNQKNMAVFQQGAYQTHHYMEWLFSAKNKRSNKLLNTLVLFSFALFLVSVLQLFHANLTMQFMLVLLLTVAFLWHCTNVVNQTKLKKALVVTPRVKRLMVTQFVLLAFCAFACSVLLKLNVPFAALMFSVCFWLPLWLVFANWLNFPLEKAIYYYYILKAKQKLKQFPNLTVVAITGSYGKTSVKFFVTHLLKQKYFTLCTPNSYNTAMGITKTVLTALKPHHEVFVVEMGADHKNDIQKLCSIVKPNIAVLTAIGNQHLKTFKTLSNIANTKFQIMENLPPNGFGVFGCSSDVEQTCYEKFNGNKVCVGENGNYYAKNITVTEDGTSFQAVTPNGELELKTKLFGNLNVSNILFAIAVAQHLGVSNDDIVSSVATLNAVNHRLELVKLPNGNAILDDSFNSNPQGCLQALQVLKQFHGYQKIIITPGMVELSSRSYEENFLFGKAMAAVADDVYVVNQTNKDALYHGLLVGGFDQKNLFFFQQFSEAMEHIKQNQSLRHIILIENDLPDSYI